jgi:hypothetical protein
MSALSSAQAGGASVTENPPTSARQNSPKLAKHASETTEGCAALCCAIHITPTGLASRHSVGRVPDHVSAATTSGIGSNNSRGSAGSAELGISPGRQIPAAFVLFQSPEGPRKPGQSARQLGRLEVERAPTTSSTKTQAGAQEATIPLPCLPGSLQARHIMQFQFQFRLRCPD